MITIESSNEQLEMTVGMGIRLTKEQRKAVEAIAKKQCNTVGGVIRLAVQQLIEQEAKAKAALILSKRKAA